MSATAIDVDRLSWCNGMGGGRWAIVGAHVISLKAGTVEVSRRDRAMVPLAFGTVRAAAAWIDSHASTEGADHVARRDGLPVTRGHLAPRAIVQRKPGKQGKREHPDDYAFRTGRPDLVAFLRECSVGGRVSRFYAADTPGMVRIWFAGPRGVFHPCEPVELTYHEIEALAFRVAVGTVHELYPARLALVS